ncbi:MAG: hypothetical protein SFX73_24710 [Kofleriaceae bacterium]|nr:hypothetical protein [Kofleriaceae bacterium]
MDEEVEALTAAMRAKVSEYDAHAHSHDKGTDYDRAAIERGLCSTCRDLGAAIEALDAEIYIAKLPGRLRRAKETDRITKGLREFVAAAQEAGCSAEWIAKRLELEAKAVRAGQPTGLLNLALLEDARRHDVPSEVLDRVRADVGFAAENPGAARRTAEQKAKKQLDAALAKMGEALRTRVGTGEIQRFERSFRINFSNHMTPEQLDAFMAVRNDFGWLFLFDDFLLPSGDRDEDENIPIRTQLVLGGDTRPK